MSETTPSSTPEGSVNIDTSVVTAHADERNKVRLQFINEVVNGPSADSGELYDRTTASPMYKNAFQGCARQGIDEFSALAEQAGLELSDRDRALLALGAGIGADRIQVERATTHWDGGERPEVQIEAARSLGIDTSPYYQPPAAPEAAQ